MKPFFDKTNVGAIAALKPVYIMRFCLFLLITGTMSILGSTQAYCQQTKTITGVVKTPQ